MRTIRTTNLSQPMVMTQALAMMRITAMARMEMAARRAAVALVILL